MYNSAHNLYFSQLALSTYLTCQLKFRRRYLEELYWPRPSTEAIELGADFHAAAERYYLTGEQVSYPGKLGTLLEALYRFRPREKKSVFLPEQQLRFSGDIKLLAKYDLLVLSDKVYIYDWKTDNKKVIKSYYRKSMQTIVYRYLIVAAGNKYLGNRTIRPNDVVMCYWNPNYPLNPLFLQYNDDLYRQDEKTIRELISEIKAKPKGEFFAAGDKSVCFYCEYSPLCHGTPREEEEDFDPDDLALSWDDIEEIPY